MKKINYNYKEIAFHLFKSYGLKKVKLEKLPGFYDQNFLVYSLGKTYFFKIYGFDTESSIRFQLSFAELLFSNNLPVAEVLPNLKGRDYSKFGKHFTVLQKILPGTVLRKHQIKSKVAFQLGEVLGKIHKSVDGVKLPGKTYKKYIWDLRQFKLIPPLLPKVQKYFSSEAVTLIKQVFEDWKQCLPQLQKLKVGYVHNDLHDNNLFYQKGKITGIVDFGDSMLSWYLADLAIPIVQFRKVKNHKQFLENLIRGYKTKFKLPEKEFLLLPLLIRMRCVGVMIGITYELGSQKIPMYQEFLDRTIIILKKFDGKI